MALEINGPPRYLTTDWEAARDSVKKLVALKPAVGFKTCGCDCGTWCPIKR